MKQQIRMKNGFVNIEDIALTLHATERMGRRGVSQLDILSVLQYGQESHKAGAIFICLRDKDIPKGERSNSRLNRLRGTVVVLSRTEADVITVYKNRKAPKHIKTKPDYDCRPCHRNRRLLQ